MFPPMEMGGALPLDRCMRVYGQLQGTGGFVITVLKKKTEIKASPEAEPKQTEPQPSIINVVGDRSIID
jgi:hypothetical protein